jgi:hypothetical protein
MLWCVAGAITAGNGEKQNEFTYMNMLEAIAIKADKLHIALLS